MYSDLDIKVMGDIAMSVSKTNKMKTLEYTLGLCFQFSVLKQIESSCWFQISV